MGCGPGKKGVPLPSLPILPHVVWINVHNFLYSDDWCESWCAIVINLLYTTLLPLRPFDFNTRHIHYTPHTFMGKMSVDSGKC